MCSNKLRPGHAHPARVPALLDAARARSAQLALTHGCTFAAEPVDPFGWVDTGVDTDVLAQPSSLMRINFATAGFWDTLVRLRAEQ